MIPQLDARRRDERRPDPAARWETLCLACGRWFGAVRSNARYCSLGCRLGLRPRRMPRDADEEAQS